MSTYIDLAPGATFRHLVSMFEEGRDGPRMDVSAAEITCVNLDPAPWEILCLPVDLTQGMFQLWIDAEFTKLAEGYAKYSFQIRLQFPAADPRWKGDMMIITPLSIACGPAYIAESPPFPLAAE